MAAEVAGGAAPDKCARCGYPRNEHSYNGACYGLCGEFVAGGASPRPRGTECDQHGRHLCPECDAVALTDEVDARRLASIREFPYELNVEACRFLLRLLNSAQARIAKLEEHFQLVTFWKDKAKIQEERIAELERDLNRETGYLDTMTAERDDLQAKLDERDRELKRAIYELRHHGDGI